MYDLPADSDAMAFTSRAELSRTRGWLDRSRRRNRHFDTLWRWVPTSVPVAVASPLQAHSSRSLLMYVCSTHLRGRPGLERVSRQRKDCNNRQHRRIALPAASLWDAASLCPDLVPSAWSSSSARSRRILG